MKKNDMEQLKKIEKEILDYYVDFCKQHNLTYYIAYGTLLGAVRHQGFIPWDDDIDVQMPPEDYQKFLKLWHNTDEYLIQNIETEKYFHTTFSKIRKNHTCMIEESWQYMPIHKGINIDIYPMFPYPDNPKETKKFEKKLKIATILISKNLKTDKLINKAVYTILKLIPRKITNKWSTKIIYKLLNYQGKYTRYKSELKNEIFELSWFEKPIKLPFEESKYLAPKKYHEMLTELYGDYMIPPKDSEKYGHGEGKLIISFDKNYEDL